MASEKLYLKHNVMVEPLVNNWYAWSYLIAPAQAAMYIANQHLKIMRSFIANPQVHVAAAKNPAMMGGPFVNYDESRVADIKALVDKTVSEQSHILEFAEAIKVMDETLTKEATGYSLETIYQKVPEALKGYVELGYDLNNNPSARFLEGLLYKSPYYNQSLQSVALSQIDKDNRPFILSTPLLEDERRLHLNIPFSHPGLDELFKAKHAPQSVEYLKEALGVRPEKEEMFASFFTEDAPQTCPTFTGGGVRVRYFGHACVLIESEGIAILTDPVLSYSYDSEMSRYGYCDLPETIDYVLITHSHSDHFILESLLQLRHKIKNIVVPKSMGGGLADPSLKLILKNTGFKNVIELDEMESVEVSEGGAVTGLPFLGEHADLHIRSKLAYSVSLNGRTMIFAADSNNIEPKLYRHLRQLIGDVDIIFLGMECVGAPMTWSYGPLLTRPLARKMDQSRRFDGSNSQKAIEMIKQLNARRVYVYAMGEEPWLTHLTSLKYDDDSTQIVESNKLIDYCRSLGLESERLFCRKEILLMADKASKAEV